MQQEHSKKRFSKFSGSESPGAFRYSNSVCHFGQIDLHFELWLNMPDARTVHTRVKPDDSQLQYLYGNPMANNSNTNHFLTVKFSNSDN